MKLTGQAKIKFEEWFQNKSQTHYRLVEWFDSLDSSMKYGVYVDFFDSVGIYIEVARANIHTKYYYMINDSSYKPNMYNTRPQAREKAIERANEILNRQLTK